MKPHSIIAGCLGLLFLSMQATSQQPGQLAQQWSASPKYNFIENRGQIIDQYNQINSDVKYFFPGNGLRVQLRQQGWSYEVIKVKKKEPKISEATGLPDDANPFDKRPEPEDITFHIQRIDVQLIGSNPCAELIPCDPAHDYINYYTTGTPEQGVTNVHHYRRVVYKDIYPKIDIEFMVTAERGIKYNFIVHPGGDYREIKLRYEGMNDLCLNQDGLRLETRFATLIETIPCSYLRAVDGDMPVVVQYKKEENGLYKFKVGKFSRKGSLIIDPVPILIWGTYYGGNNDDNLTSAADAHTGNSIYISGYTKSSSNIATSGAYDENYNPGTTYDAFLAKFTNNGALLWATYYGGNDEDVATEVACDNFGNVIITGYTESVNYISTPGTQQPNHAGGSSDAFIAKFDGNGSRQWGTYYGGFSSDGSVAISTDRYGDIYIAGTTTSASIATAGAFSIYLSGLQDAFLAKFSTNGLIVWGTYYGGSGSEGGSDVAIDINGNVYLAGGTSSTNNIATPGAYQQVCSSCAGGGGDGYLAKFSNGGQRLWGTYFGGGIGSITCDLPGSIYITGMTYATSGIATSGAHQTSKDAYSDAFLAKFDGNGSLQWGTYYGGNSSDSGDRVTTDINGNVYLAGGTGSTNNIATPGAYKEVCSPCLGSNGNDIFLVKFTTGGQRSWGTYFGGSNDDWCRSIITDRDGNIYLSGGSSSVSGIATPGTHQQTHLGGPNAGETFIVKLWEGGILLSPYKISGKVYGDINSNCNYNSGDYALDYTLVKAEPGPWYGITDTNGNYTIHLPDTGSFSVSVISTDSLWKPACISNYNVRLTSISASATNIDFARVADFYCYRLKVDIGTPFLRRCFNNSYNITFANTGSLPVNNAFIEVDFDSYIQPLSSSISWTSVSGNVYSFPIGVITPGETRQIYVTTHISCAAPLGGTHCVTARIYPDALCSNPDPAFDRRKIYVLGECVNRNTAQFTIWNAHQSLTYPMVYEIFVNGISVGEVSHTFLPNDTIVVSYPADGNTVRLETRFVPTNYIESPQFTIEGCGTPAVFGQVNSLPQNDEGLNVESDCKTIFGSYDPNDKLVFPQGITTDRYIKPNTELEYLIRFQNTGNDTAFNVVISDTISEYLDVATLVPGASSHPYEFNIYGQGIAQWTFNNILLPDSIVNEPESNGYVKFKINQKPNNPNGTVIQNAALIRFDYNEPLLTNEAWNTVYDTTISRCPNQSVPELVALGSTTLCAGDNVTLISNNIGDILWSTGATSESIIVNSSGSISITMLIDSNGCISGPSDSIDVRVEECNGINEADLNNINIIPNPTKEKVLIQWQPEAQVNQIILSDICGKQLQQVTIATANHLELLLKDYSEGIYLVTVKGNGQRTFRVVKLD